MSPPSAKFLWFSHVHEDAVIWQVQNVTQWTSLLIFACLTDFKVSDNVFLNCPFYMVILYRPGLIKYIMLFFKEFAAKNSSFSEAELFCDDTCYFLDIGLSARHAKLLWVHSPKCLPPFGVQRLETHHSVSASEDMVSIARLYNRHQGRDSQSVLWDEVFWLYNKAKHDMTHRYTH